MTPKELYHLLRRNGCPCKPKPHPLQKLHAAITERGEIDAMLRANVRNGKLGIYWSGRTYCDSNGAFVEATRVKMAPTVRGFYEWVDETDPWIEGPCSWKLFPPTYKEMARGY